MDVISLQVCRSRDNPSVLTSDKAYCIPANPMSDRGQAVCYAVYDARANDDAYKYENMRESRYKPVCVMATSHWNAPFTAGDVSPTICARARTGGNQLPLIVLKRIDE